MRNNENGILRYFTEIQRIVASIPPDEVEEVVNLFLVGWQEGRCFFLCGNGGSASTASHFACDLGKGTIGDNRPRLKAVALTDNMTLVTAWANDAGYEHIFAEQLRNLVQAGDIVIGISASGNSPNILNAMRAARFAGAVTIGFAGFQGGELKTLVHRCIIVPSSNMGQIEDMHMILQHSICQNLRERMRS